MPKEYCGYISIIGYINHPKHPNPHGLHAMFYLPVISMVFETTIILILSKVGLDITQRPFNSAMQLTSAIGKRNELLSYHEVSNPRHESFISERTFDLIGDRCAINSVADTPRG